MQLVGKLKEQVEQAASKEEAKDAILAAGMKLDEKELEEVTGGIQIGIQDEEQNLVGGRSPLSPSQSKALDGIGREFDVTGREGCCGTQSFAKSDMTAQVWLQGRGKKDAVLY